MCVCVGVDVHASLHVCEENSTFFFFPRPTYAKLLLLSEEKKKDFSVQFK